MNNRTTVSISKELRERLREYGMFGESFSQVFLRILNEIDELKGKNKKK